MRLMKLLFFILPVLLAAFFSNAQSSVRVHVQNAESGYALDFAYVNVYSLAPEESLERSVNTDERGIAVIDIERYPVKVEVIKAGFRKESRILKEAVREIHFSLLPFSRSLDEIVVTGVSRPAKIRDALSVYKTISAKTIQALGAVTLDQALAAQLHISIGNDNILGASMRMQGLSGDKVKILMDGMPVNGREAGNIDLGQLNLYNVERIEIVQGPMSVVYGTDALGGVINLITKNNRKPWSLDGNIYYETVGKYNFNFSGTRSWKRHALTLGAGRNFSEGWKFTDSSEPHRQLLFKPKEQYLVNFNYSYQAPSGFRLRVASDFLKEKITNKGPASITPYEGYAFDDYYRTGRSLNRLLLEGKSGSRGYWNMMHGFSYYRRSKNTFRKDLVSLEQYPVSGMQDTSVFGEISSRGNYSSKFLKADYTLGYDADLQTGRSEKIPGGTKDIGNYALFASVKMPLISRKLELQPGIRFQHNTAFKAPLIPALNLLFMPEKNLQLRASYARGFRAPSLKEMYLVFVDQNHNVFGNADLKAEYSSHFQFSASCQFPAASASDYIYILFSGFFNDVKDGIVLSPDDPSNPGNTHYSYRNVGRQRNFIASLESEGQWQGLHCKLGYALNYMLEEKGQYGDFTAQEFSVSLQYFWKKPEIDFSVFNKYTGSQPFLRANIDGSAAYDGRQPAYNMLDFSASRNFFYKKVELTAGIKNILDVQQIVSTGLSSGGVHSSSGTISFLPRSFFTSLNIRLE